MPSSCYPASSFFNLGAASEPWNINGPGFITYTFSSPVTSATIGYSIVDNADYGTISINGPGTLQLSNPCNLSITGNTIQGAIPAGSGDVRLTVSSNQPFTVITFRDDPNSATLIKQGNLCNFQLTTPQTSPTIVSCPKLYLDTKCYNTTMAQTTLMSLFSTDPTWTCRPATIGGVPCNQSNTSIQMITPLPFGCFFNPDGTLTYPAGTKPFDSKGTYYYKLCSLANPSICSENYRVDFGIQPTIEYELYPTACASFVYGQFQLYGVTNVFSDLLFNPTTSGQCSTFVPATVPYHVTMIETTSPLNPYYRINYTGEVELRPGVNPATVPLTRQELFYRICDTRYPTICVEKNYQIVRCNGARNTINTENEKANDALVEISPNPSLDSFTLFFDNEMKFATIEIYNIVGQLIQSTSIVNTSEHTVTNLEKGIYIIKVSTNEKVLTKKIIKQ